MEEFAPFLVWFVVLWWFNYPQDGANFFLFYRFSSCLADFWTVDNLWAWICRNSRQYAVDTGIMMWYSAVETVLWSPQQRHCAPRAWNQESVFFFSFRYSVFSFVTFDRTFFTEEIVWKRTGQKFRKNKNTTETFHFCGIFGTAKGTRTPDLLIRSAIHSV